MKKIVSLCLIAILSISTSIHTVSAGDGSYSKRGMNRVEIIFEDLLKENSSLENLLDREEKLKKETSEKLEIYNRLKNYYLNYYQDAKTYIQNVSDTSLQKSLRQNILAQEESFQKLIQNTEAQYNLIQKNNLTIQNLIIKLKVQKTLTHIKKSQEQEEWNSLLSSTSALQENMIRELELNSN
jgi:hypothetical protein